jgi:hypothetical protein
MPESYCSICDKAMKCLSEGDVSYPFNTFYCFGCGSTVTEITQDHPDWSDTEHMNPELADILYDEMKGN